MRLLDYHVRFRPSLVRTRWQLRTDPRVASTLKYCVSKLTREWAIAPGLSTAEREGVLSSHRLSNHVRWVDSGPSRQPIPAVWMEPVSLLDNGPAITLRAQFAAVQVGRTPFTLRIRENGVFLEYRERAPYAVPIPLAGVGFGSLREGFEYFQSLTGETGYLDAFAPLMLQRATFIDRGE